MQAHAVVAVEPWRVEYRSVEVPDPSDDEVVMRVTHSWISNGTEGSFVRGERIAGDTPRRPEDPLPFPHVPGYQKIGVVEWAGSGAGEFSVGESVFATVSRVSGMFYPAGGHVSPAVTHRSQVWKLPPEVPPVTASGLVLTQVGYNCGMRPAIEPGDAAIVVGDGMVGHWSAQTFAWRGARVLLAGKHAERLMRFAARSEDRVVDVTREDPIEVARAWAPGGVRAVIDTVGSVPAIESYYPVLSRGGAIVSAGFHGTAGTIDIQRMRDRELALHAPAGWTADRMDRTLELLRQGALRTEHLITHRFPVERAAEAFDLILRRREPVLGVVLEWD